LNEEHSSVLSSRFIGTANFGYAQQAQEEVRRLIPSVKYNFLIHNEVFIMESPLSIDQCIKIIKEQEPIFLRHIQPINTQLKITRTFEDLKLIEEHIQQRMDFHSGERVTVQIRREPDLFFEYTTIEMKNLIQNMINDKHKVNTVARHADKVLSLFLSKQFLFLGISHPLDNLSDWSGGAIRYKKEENQISRAKFKLLEAEDTFGLNFTQFTKALDIGAAPGGWTSLLLDRGLTVTAIDPANLHPSLKENKNLTYLQKNANDVSFRIEEFDLIVCDMSWSPRQMSKLVDKLIYALKRGGTAIITAKLMHKNSFQAVREIRKWLEPQLKLIKAKQLFHNRNELTLYFIRKVEQQ